MQSKTSHYPSIDFMIAGAEKAGTTSLLKYLGQHPGVCVHEKMEMTFFVRDEEYQEGYDRAFAQYFEHKQPDQHILAKNVGCMYFEDAIRRMHEHNPAMKIIVVLRNPVDRAYSAFWYARQMGTEVLDCFDDAILAEPKRQASGSDHEKRFNMYLDRGMYGRQIDYLLTYFPRDQLHVILFEDLKSNPAGVIKATLDFLALPQLDIQLSKKHNAAALPKSRLLARLLSEKNVFKSLLVKLFPPKYRRQLKSRLRKINRAEFVIPPLAEDVRQQLQSYFAADIIKAESLLKIDLSAWKQ